ncbi:unnamed protein product [Trifolium pratense]|uniref:Uncharacterized protein n=1 Tax=Trifolium pratense TaxID=57577 RepID=A0ACB0J219_TRIPR|nr:unnamed protein product [Trifolium pratense]
MDSALNAALEEICTHVEEGITLQSLFSKLQSINLNLTPSFQQSIFTNLLRIPTLRFEPPNPNPNYDQEDHNLIKIFPQQTLSHNFVGIYDPQSLQQSQLRVLHLLANAKHNGITQTQLSKQLRIDPNNFHYVLRTLECKGLIVKRSALEKKTQIHTSSSSSVNYTPLNITTHLVYLRRYANKPLAQHQRFEFQITQFNQPDSQQQQLLQTHVRLADYEPPIKAICDKLANANGKVLLVSDIKKDLGYCGSRPKQRAWRQIAARLKAHQIVEQFDAKVNGKIEACLRLLDPITTESGNEDKNSDSGNICQLTDQLVELPIEHQIFDIIDTAGSDGITIKEICDRLQIDLKKNHIRLVSLCHRFGMKVQEEQCLKSKTIRVWTSRNFNSELEVALIHKLDENKILDHHLCDSSSKIRTEFEASTFKGELVDPDKLEDVGAGAKLSCASPNNVESNYVEAPTNLQGPVPDQRGTTSHSKPVSLPMEGNIALSKAFPSDALTPISARSYQRYASLSLSADGTKKAIRILERLKDERYVLRPELNRWLNTFEKDKSKKVDRKTLDRILTKLQEQGQCKCIKIRIPVIAEYSKTTDCVIVVHPSVSLSPELHDEMQDKVRSFKNDIHSKSTRPQKNDELIPVMENVQKTQSLIVPGHQADKAEAMRANGFIIAKMVRAKLLHIFLWDYLHRSENCSDAVSSNGLADNPHSSSKLFSLDAAINAIPVELFLQIAGSTKKYEEMIDKCKKGLCLSDLPAIDTLAIGRLSLIIDILRRLKLIRVIISQSIDGVKTPHALTHMMELRPYIEEPLSNDAASLNFTSLDLRPRIRHDFVLSNRYAVDEYWRTLEYCYAAANRKAALYAFPGSVVHEVFRFRSWASNRLMTAEQRAELLKHVTKHDLSEKISYRDCDKIAKDLNLTLEQVLSMYYSKRRHGLNQLNDEESEDNSLERKGNSSFRRKKDSPELRPAKHARIDAATGVMEKHIDDQHMGIYSEEQATHMQEFEEVNYEIEGSPDCSPCISQRILTATKAPRQRRFIWSDKTDRQLVIQYVRYRAVLGANYHRVDWASLSDLPAPPRACMRRMNFLNANLRFRKAVNRLCTMLSEQYAKQLEKSQNLSSNKDDCRLFVQSQSSKGVHNSFTPDVEIHMSSLNGEVWDNFENKSIETALDEILRCKKMAKLDASSQNDQSQYEDWNRYESRENGKTTAAIPSEIIQSHHGKPHTFSSQRSCLDMKFSRFLNNRPSSYGQVYESLAVSNAVELFKLVFLSTATNPQAPNLLADILRHYSEHDLVAAFNYLREKKIMVGGNGSDERFELSLRFLDSISKSPFPFDTGKQAVKFSAWLKERDKDLTEMGTDLVEDLQCGDTFHLFALISSGELSISPSLPDNGVGEADDLRSGKRKPDASGSSFSDKAKKLKSSFGVEGEIISRREKGFPGIIISVHRTEVSKADILDLFKDNDNNNQHFNGNVQLDMGQNSNYSLTDHMLETFNSCDPVPEEKDHIESPWESMAGYVRRLTKVPYSQEQECAVCAEVFVVVYAAIQKAGDQGLSMGEIHQVINLPDIDGLIVDALQAFGKALKVNAYDSVRIVDALYRHKYFMTTVSGFHPVVQPSSNKTIKKSDNTCQLPKSKESNSASAEVLRERNSALDNVHKVTILNLPQEDVDPENKACDRNEGCMQDRPGSSRGDHEKEMVKVSSGELCMPILPWINGDGTVNSIVFKGLRRRVLGIVMQNPGILEDDILRQMHMLNPQSCRTLLELMVLDKLLIARKMYQNIFGGGPSMLQNLIGSKSCQRKWICAEHFFANPMSTSLL